MNDPSERSRVLVHPLLVTVPIGCWVGSFVFDIGSRVVVESAFLTRGSYWLVGIGLIGAIIAGIAGFIDAMPIPPGTRAYRTLMAHLLVTMTIVLLYGINFVFRAAAPMDRPVPGGLIALSAVGVTLIVAAAVAGGALAHHGAGGYRARTEQRQPD